jgi:RimJ/RimL family protein N-acetyltransferase
LRQPLPGDVDDIVAQCRDPEFQRWTRAPVPYHESDAQDFLKRVAEGWRANVAMFTVAYQGRFSGSLELQFDRVGGAEVGFGLAPWARGTGHGRDDPCATASAGLGSRAAGSAPKR